MVASDLLIVQVIMSCRDIKRSSGSNHVLYLISILNCHRAVMNVCLNEMWKKDCGFSANKNICGRYLVMVNDNKTDLQDETGDECRAGKVGEIPSRGDTPPRHGLDGANLKVR